MEENGRTILDPLFLRVIQKLPPLLANHALIHGIMSVLFFVCVFFFSPSLIQIGNPFDAKQTIYFKRPKGSCRHL